MNTSKILVFPLGNYFLKISQHFGILKISLPILLINSLSKLIIKNLTYKDKTFLLDR